MTEESINPRKGRIVFLAIVAIFVIPFVGANYFYKKAQDGQLWGTTNNGILIQPAKPLGEIAAIQADGETFTLKDLRGKWTMLYVATQGCEQDCKQTIFYMRHIWALLNKESHRVKRLLIVDESSKAQLADFLINYPEMMVVTDVGLSLQKQLPADISEEPVIYLVDPIGNVMMAFPQSLDAAKIFKDLKKLLKISQVG